MAGSTEQQLLMMGKADYLKVGKTDAASILNYKQITNPTLQERDERQKIFAKWDQFYITAHRLGRETKNLEPLKNLVKAGECFFAILNPEKMETSPFQENVKELRRTHEAAMKALANILYSALSKEGARIKPPTLCLANNFSTMFQGEESKKSGPHSATTLGSP